MPISVACPTCGAKLKAPDTAVGKKIKCPKCGSLIPVSEADAGAAPGVTDEPAGEELAAVSAADDPGDEAGAPDDEAADDEGRPPKKKKKGREGGPVSEDDKLWGMLAHLAGGLFHWLGALIVFFIKKDQSRFLGHHTKEALNFQITMVIGWVLVVILSCCMQCGGGLAAVANEFLGLAVRFLAFLPYMILGAVNLLFCVLAAMAAKRGDWYKYPFAIRLIK
jgi:uncharacterized Tic20 family protein